MTRGSACFEDISNGNANFSELPRTPKAQFKRRISHVPYLRHNYVEFNSDGCHLSTVI